jgi:hypothetical protein
MDRFGKSEDRIKRAFTYNSEPSTAKWTYFDQFYRKNYTTISAMAWKEGNIVSDVREDIKGRSLFTDFKDSFLRNIDDAPALFPLRNVPTQVERNAIRKQIMSHLDIITEFENSVGALEKRKVMLGDFLIEKTTTPRTDEPIVFGNWRVMKVNLRSDGTPVYLREENSAKSWFAGFVESFVIKETDCFVLPRQGDPDYVRRASGECRTDFIQWKRDRQSRR